jgi:F-type H+-transporting ATPase subunit delta
MANSIAAYRYAKSLIDLANEKKITAEVSKDLALVKDVCSENRELMQILANPIVRHEKKFGILKSIFESRVNPVTFSLFSLLAEKNREGLLLSIVEEFQKLNDTQEGIQRAEVVSAVALSDEQRKEIIATVKKLTGKEAQLQEKINEQLIGGYVLKIGDTQIDTSVKKQLSNLRLTLAQV